MWRHILTVVVAFSLFAGSTARIRPQVLMELRRHANAIVQIVEGLDRRHRYEVYPSYYPGQAIQGEYEYEDYEASAGDPEVIIRKALRPGGRPSKPRPKKPKPTQKPTKIEFNPQFDVNIATQAPEPGPSSRRFLLSDEASGFNDDVFQAVGRAFKTNIRGHPDLRRELGDDFNPITYLKSSPPTKIFGRIPPIASILDDSNDKL